MLQQTTISNAPEAEPALDQARLFAEGLEHVRRLARRVWTDHNTHDPGVTILELASYALTDLAYRAQWPIEDLLTDPRDAAGSLAQQFFGPAEALPSAPLTVDDYRRLLIDLPKVRNAWIRPESTTYFVDVRRSKLLHAPPAGPGAVVRQAALRGLYRAVVEFEDGLSDADKSAAKTAVFDQLNAHRNLCEEFVAVDEVATEQFALCAEIELASGASPVEVAAQIYFCVEQQLAPPVGRYSLSEMLARRRPDGAPYTLPDVFEGPLLEHGFIDAAELQQSELRGEVRLSDVVSVVMDVPGVRAIREMTMNALARGPDDRLIVPTVAIPPVDKWRLTVPPGRRARLVDREDPARRFGRIVFYQRNLPVPADPAAVTARLRALFAEDQARRTAIRAEDLLAPPPRGRARNAAAYQSFQQHFPRVYGLSAAGLAADAGARRRVQALQLKGYLLFFDQVLADFCGQLGGLARLFSRSEDEKATYFSQVVDSFRDFARIYQGDLRVDDPNDPQHVKGAEKLAERLETSAEWTVRRSRFLDHLLARMGEDFHHYVDVVQHAFAAGADSTIVTRCKFLQDASTLSLLRGQGAGLFDPPGADPESGRAVSGLERRLVRLLGLEQYSARPPAQIAFDTDQEIETTAAGEFQVRITHPATGVLLLGAPTVYATREAAADAARRMISRGQSTRAYKRNEEPANVFHFQLLDRDGTVLAESVDGFPTEEALRQAVAERVAHFADYYLGERLFLIEDLLLRPAAGDDDSFLSICADPDCTACADDDPYSYRLHVILPAFAGRFQNMDFRRFVEETIRLESPAHVLPRVCWVDADSLSAVVDAWRDWMQVRRDAAAPDRKAKLQALRAALDDAKSVYPKQKLSDCVGGEGERPFVLDRNSLGSEP